jgi:stage III sporulation protein AF
MWGNAALCGKGEIRMQEILEMTRVIAVFYLLEQMALNLLPGKIYERYVKFYLGLLLVLLLLQPVFRVFRLTEQMDAEALLMELEQEVESFR